MVKIKKSYGVICYRTGNNGFQVLMIKKPYTYYFYEFVMGHYSKHEEKHLMRLFNNMTYFEKMDILSLNFAQMWYRIHKSAHVRDGEFYIKKKAKFETSFSIDGGKALRAMIMKSHNVETSWEIPKGRKKDSFENDIDCATREFAEETGIPLSAYNIQWRIKPYIETYTDLRITYQSIYYFADIPQIAAGFSTKFSDIQMVEVAATQWCDRSDLSRLNLEPNALRRLMKMFEKIKSKVKNAK